MVGSHDHGVNQVVPVVPVDPGLHGAARNKDRGNVKAHGRHEHARNDLVAYAKEQGGWLFVSDCQECLSTVPADPAGLLGGMQNQYDVAVRLELKTGSNPYKGRRNKLTPRQLQRKTRLMRHVKKKR